MSVEKIKLVNFRNIEDTVIDVSSPEVILTGENGQGKTNLIEALYILCYGNSFRTQKLSDCIKHGKEAFDISFVYKDVTGLESTVSFSYDGETKNIRIDGRPVRDRKELIYNLPCIVFSHEDMEFVRGEPENRRRFFNQIMTMYDVPFFDYLRAYGHVLRQRNVAIKDARIELLDVYDMKLADYGKHIVSQRAAVCEAFDAIFPDIYSMVSGEDRKISIAYRPSWSQDMTTDGILEKLRSSRETDIHMGTTTSGPHRDRFLITDRNGLFLNSASTGQIRLASIVMRIAQAAFFRQKTGENPLLLVDDVLLELDSVKRSRCLAAFGKYSQAFFTFLPDEKYFSDDDSRPFRKYIVSKGVFHEK